MHLNLHSFLEIFQQNTLFNKKSQNFNYKFEITNAKMLNFFVGDFFKIRTFLLNNNYSRIVGKIVCTKISEIWMKIGQFNFCQTLLKLLWFL